MFSPKLEEEEKFSAKSRKSFRKGILLYFGHNFFQTHSSNPDSEGEILFLE